MIDEIRLGFAALRARGVPAPEALDLLPLEALQTALLGLDAARRPHVLLEVADEDMQRSLPSGIATVDFTTRPLVVAGRTRAFLDITCLFEAVAEVFEHFVVAVLDRIDRGRSSPVDALTSVLERWRDFLTPAHGPPSREKLAGILGELLVLADIVAADPAKRVDAWVGPFGGRHDLRRADCAIEVKTTRAHASRSVRINGEDQLDVPEDGTLYLHVVRLEDVPDGGVSVAGVIDGLLATGAPAEALFSALSAAGVPLAELAGTADVSFDVRERRTFVVGDGTPRIVPRSFVGASRPLGVADLTYSVDLDLIWDQALDDHAYQSLVGAVAVQ
jgi:hypothetical protein